MFLGSWRDVYRPLMNVSRLRDVPRLMEGCL